MPGKHAVKCPETDTEFSIGSMGGMSTDKSMRSSKSVCIRLSFASGELAVRTALGQLKQGLAPMRLSKVDESNVELVLGEVLNNVVEHAYGANATGQVTLECLPAADRLRFCVRDSGKPFPGLHLPVARQPIVDGPEGELPEGGFGFFLVRSLATELNYRRESGRNLLSFHILLSPYGGSG